MLEILQPIPLLFMNPPSQTQNHANFNKNEVKKQKHEAQSPQTPNTVEI